VPAGFNDTELDFLMQTVVLPLVDKLAPQALVVACGADALAGDPLTRMGLSNETLWRAVESLVGRSPAAAVLGGGGYNPWTVARYWAGLWARLSGRDIPAELPESAQRILRSLSCELLDEDTIEESWTRTLADTPRTGPVRAEVKDLAAHAVARRHELCAAG
jgi:acetoin utilization protein AcuC